MMKASVRIASLSIESENLDPKLVGELVGRIIGSIVEGSITQPQLSAGKKRSKRKPASLTGNNKTDGTL
jgi:hypothetical protein